MKPILICIVLLLTVNPLFSQKSKKLEQLFSTYEKAGLFSGSVLIADKGKIIFEKSYGYRNAPKKEKNTNNSLYRVFSTTKMFTATVIFQLEEQGKLSLNDKLSKYYPDFPKGDSITIANLLSHTSGIPNDTNSEYTVDEETFIKYISAKPLNFSPGKDWDYSNSGYYILSYIIKKVTGLDYDQVIENNILKPLKMNHSGFHFNNVIDENKAFGYEFLSDNKSNEALRFKTDHPFGAGAMYSTVEDLFKFNEALKNYSILKKETIDKAFTPYLKDDYGLGFQISTVFDKKRVGHDGGGPGYRSRYYRILQDDICVIVISNSELSHTDFIFPLVEKILYNKPYNIPTIAKVSREDLKKLEGVYSAENSNFYIKSADGKLVFKEGSYPRNALLPLNKTSFQLDEKFTCTFQPDQNGKINTVVIHFWDGTVKTAKRNTSNPTWGIIGNATPSGWDGKDIPLQTDPKNRNIYFLKNYTLKKGNLKFRFNNDWGYSLGLNNDNKSIAFDAYDFPIHEDGVYDITLDMTDIVKPQYSIKKSNS
ncbi:CubicO group peptidase (beta-lactamase class C family) [Chryseobacterium sp. 7]|uniref:serine hydrolase n=1 Tax=Chryseobacterium sp. 7 TaxID=2035214 RepID=UPI000EB41949|nr:serine hydrolase [Chryseobacterium sp. 7]RLJ34079.1 CubicO group peptidase (beta-lactamase class C family) [Chryseobacterium sp. 7]